MALGHRKTTFCPLTSQPHDLEQGTPLRWSAPFRGGQPPSPARENDRSPRPRPATHSCLTHTCSLLALEVGHLREAFHEAQGQQTLRTQVGKTSPTAQGPPRTLTTESGQAVQLPVATNRTGVITPGSWRLSEKSLWVPCPVQCHPVPNPGSSDPTQPTEEYERPAWAPERVGRDCPRAAGPGSVHAGSGSSAHAHVQPTPVLATLGLATKRLTERTGSPPALVATIRLWKVATALRPRRRGVPARSAPSWTVQPGREGRGRHGGRGQRTGPSTLEQEFTKTIQQEHTKTWKHHTARAAKGLGLRSCAGQVASPVLRRGQKSRRSRVIDKPALPHVNSAPVTTHITLK